MALIGVPSPTMVWLALLLRGALVQEVGEDFDGAVLDSDEATDTFLASEKNRNLFIISHFPRERLFEWLEREAIPAVIVLADTIECVSHLIAAGQANAYEAVRPVSQSLSLIHRSRQLTHRAIVLDWHMDIEVERFAFHLLRLCIGGDLSNLEERLRALDIVSGETIRESIGRQSEPSLAAARSISLSPELEGHLRAICDPLIDMIRGNDDVEIVWNAPFFYDGSSHIIPAPIAMELIGPARCLYYGPYMHLPPGRYRGGAMIGLSNDIIETYLRIEIYTDRPIAEFMTIARKGGMFIMPIELDITDARLPIQLRIFIDRGEIEGKLGFASAKLQPVAVLAARLRH